jgi:hypothetical protein
MCSKPSSIALSTANSSVETAIKIIRAILEDREIRRIDDEKTETSFFSVAGIMQILTNPIHQEWRGVSVKAHKDLRGLQTQNLRYLMSEAKFISTALGELSTRQIAENTTATGLAGNKATAKTGGSSSQRARLEVEH